MPTRTYTVPACYAPYLYSVLRGAVDTAKRDTSLREKGNHYPPVPDFLISEHLAGEIVLTITVPEQCTRAADEATQPASSTSAAPLPGSARAPFPEVPAA